MANVRLQLLEIVANLGTLPMFLMLFMPCIWLLSHDHLRHLQYSSGKPQSINYLAQLIGGPVSYILRGPANLILPMLTYLKPSRLLVIVPKVSFEEGVDLVLKNIDYWRDAPVWTPSTIADATELWHNNLS